MKDAFDKNWITTAGENVNEVERIAREYVGVEEAVALSCGTAALHLAVKLAGERLYGMPAVGHGTLEGKKVFCSDMTFDATVNPVVYEGGIPVFIDTEYYTWNMSPQALEKAFEIYPEVKLVVLVNLYGTPAKIKEIREICDRNGALLIEDAAESLGAKYNGKMTGTYGDYSIISFNGNKIITGSSGGALLVHNKEDADKARKWSTQSREAAPWYQHEELGYNYRMSNIIAGIIRGQFEHIDEHIARKKEIYERYKEGFKDLPIQMNPHLKGMEPNYWLSCLLINKEAMCKQVRSDNEALYVSEKGKSCPAEILETLAKYNAEGRPIWKPMHMQPIYRLNPFITKNGNGRARTNAYIEGRCEDAGMDIFERGLCLPRLIDILFGIVGLIITVLLTIVITPMIMISDPGPIFFRQERVGKNGRIFKMWKFRTMYKDAEDRKAELMSQNKMDGLMFKMEDDPRIIGYGKKFSLGKFLRETSIDEFPQAINLLSGSMSLVGSRPPTKNEYEQYQYHHKGRLAMKPGITGMWQVSGRNNITDFEKVVELDKKYIENFSLMLDVKIILKTIKILVLNPFIK